HYRERLADGLFRLQTTDGHIRHRLPCGKTGSTPGGWQQHRLRTHSEVAQESGTEDGPLKRRGAHILFRPPLLPKDRHGTQQPEEPAPPKREPTTPDPQRRHQDKPSCPRLLSSLGEVDNAFAIDDAAIRRNPTNSERTDHRLTSFERSSAILWR